ncbi:MAG TPA: amino acid adenylation domain-containing protein, partial [Thermoanaerobaculia bacterium]|nr:amino acid adenylation domain-containing protein [Thermoanaerobaculia bacterium]
DFFDLGGHSLLATRVVSRVRQVFGVDLPLRALFESSTLEAFATRIEAARREARGLQAPPIVPVPRGFSDQSELPLSFAQERLWLFDRMQPGLPAYNVPDVARWRGPLRVDVLARVLDEIVARHESLRTRIEVSASGKPVQVIDPRLEVPVPVADLQALPAAAREAEARRQAEEETWRPFDLARGPVLRACVLRLAPDDHVTVFTRHHIASDGWSMEVFSHELAVLYDAFSQGLPSPLPPLPVQYADFAVWQRRWLSGALLEEQLGWWRERLAGAPALLQIPTDRPRPAVQAFEGAIVSLRVPVPRALAFEELCRREGVTVFMALLAAWDALLARYGAGTDLVVGSPVANRHRIEVERLIGFFANTMVLRTDLSGDPTVRELLGRVRETALGAYEHQDTPFERLVEELRPERSLSHTPLFQTMIALNEMGGDAGDAGDTGPAALESRPFGGARAMSRYDLELYVFRGPGFLELALEYRIDLFDATRIARMLEHLSSLLDAMAADSGLPLSGLSFLSEAERHQLELEWGRAEEVEGDGGETVLDLFEAQAASRAEAVAIVQGDAPEAPGWTYGELDRTAATIAARLRDLEVGLEVRVGVLSGRTPAAVAALLGVWKAGGVYVPLDPFWPAARLELLLRDSGVRVLLAAEPLLDRLAAVEHGAEVLLLENLPAAGSPLPGRGRGVAGEGLGVRAGDLAYLIYTSGTTGTPKAVMVEHRNLLHTLRAGQALFGLGPDDTLACLSPFTFDIAFFELLAPLLAGGRLVLMDLRPAPDLGRLVSVLEGVDVFHAVPSLMRQIAETVRAGQDRSLPRLRAACMGGEAVSPHLLEELAEAWPGVRPWVLYGPTETTIVATAHKLQEGDAHRTWPGTWLGRPLPGFVLRLLDAGGQPVPAGVTGELYIGGPAVTRGYLGREDLTAERFVEIDGGRFYRTGDLARFLPDGGLIYLGRIDDQVKVRGFRIELGEVESALAALPGVRQAAVVVRGEGADRRLAAFVVPEREIDSRRLREGLLASLPEYMVPGEIVAVAELPLSPTGKVDRRALEALAPQADAAAAGSDAPRTATKQLIARIWADLLGVETVGAHDSFFDLGGHSLLATQVISRVRSAFRVDLPMRVLFDRPTVAGLAAAVRDASQEGGLLDAPPISPLPRPFSADPPLSFAQERLWFLERLAPGGVYNVPFAARLLGALRPEVFERALAEVVHRHETLRTTFRPAGDHAVQRIAPTVRVPLVEVDLSGLEPARHEAETWWLAEQETALPFDLERGPLLRTALLRMVPGEHVLLATIHHIVSDGWSIGVLLRELGEAYAALAAGRPPRLPGLPVQYADFAVWQRRWLADEVLEAELAHWRERLAGVPATLELPSDRPRPAVQSFHGATVPMHLGAPVARDASSLGRSLGATLFMVLLSAYEALLGRLGGQYDMVVGSAVANRNRAETEGLIGFFVNTLALRGDLSGDPSFAELVGRARETTLDAYAHQDLPFEKLVQELRPERSLSHAPLFQVMFGLQNLPASSGDGSSLPFTMELIEVFGATAKFDLTLSLAEGAAGLTGTWEYSRDLFDAVTVARLARSFSILLAGAVADPGRRLSDLPLLAAEERHQLLVDWNDTGREAPAVADLHGLVADQARRTPDAVAVIGDGAALSYGELSRRADRLARVLAGLGVGPEERVGICLGASLERVTALLAVLAAGGAYVPLDPDHPAERLAAMVRDSGMNLLLTVEELAGRVGEAGVEILLLDRPLPELDAGFAGPLPGGLAYMIYTSGSTGVPNGVLVGHAGAARFIEEAVARLGGLGPLDRVPQVAAFGFDASVLETFAPLAAGAALCLVSDEERRLPEALARRLAEQEATALVITPAMLATLPLLPAVRALWVGGDLCPPEMPAVWAPGRLFLNCYGPTETTVFATTEPCDGTASGPLPIGRPVGGGQAYVLDRALRPLPVGAAGELALGGSGLARGYQGRPDKTADKFVPNPFESGARLYRTGDLARRLPDGRLEFLGRIDRQVKIRGVRMEPGEIEAALGLHPEVAAAAVLAPGDGAGRRLVAFFVPRDAAAVAGTTPEPADLRAFLRGRLPEAMVPVAFLPLDVLPLTPNGKIDRRLLTAWAEGGVEAREHVAPRTPAEERLAAIWAEVLGLERVGARDSFFELGGHSLLATRVVSRVREAFGVDLPLRTVFETPALEELAARIEKLARRTVHAVPPLTRAGRRGDPPLSYSQHRLWFIDRLQPGSAAYNMPFAVRVTGPLSPAVLAGALLEVQRRHEALRTTFAERSDREGEAVQVIAPEPRAHLARIDLAVLPGGVRRAEEERLVAAEAASPFDLERGPLLRTVLLEAGPEEAILVLNQHHIVSDGWSSSLLVEEIGALYAAFAAGQASPLPELPVQYADFAIWQRGWLSGEVLAAEIEHWRRRLEGAPPVMELPADRPRPAEWSGRGGVTGIVLPAALSAGLQKLARREGATLFMVLVAAWQALLARHTGNDDGVLGTPIAGRNQIETERLIGFFVNTLALRLDFSARGAELPDFREVLRRTREVALDAYAHQEIPFEKLVEELRPERNLSHSPLFQALFSLQNLPAGAIHVSDITLEAIDAESWIVKFDLSLSMIEIRENLVGTLSYAADLFDLTTMRRLLGGFEALLAAVVAAPEKPLAEIGLLSAAARHQLEAEWNDTASLAPEVSCLHELFERQAARQPEATAVVFQGERVSYGELDRWANCIAWRLRRAGARPGERVAVCVERSPERPAALLGVSKSGAAWVALDPEHPPARLAELIADAGCRLVLVSDGLRDRLPGFDGELLSPLASGERDDPPPPLAGPSDLAYVVYTSGSTGKPKGTLAHHGGAAAYLSWVVRHYGFGPEDTALQLATLTFDASVRDHLAPLAAGARLVIVTHDEARDPEALLDRIAEQGVTLLPSAVPSLLRRLAETAAARGRSYPSVRLVLAAGERLYGADGEAVRAVFGPETRLFNQYGATECTMSSTYQRVGETETVPVGRPIDDARAHVLDRFFHLAPLGAPGEIVLGSPGLTYGYLGQPDRTAEAFIPDPFCDLSNRPGARLYRTGDRGRRLADGTLDYLGRLDHQVKVRGQRVEPGEVEAAILAYPGIRAAAVVAQEERPGAGDLGGWKLAAFVVPRETVDLADLRADLRDRLPAHLVPSAWAVLDTLPLTPHGKVDRQALSRQSSVSERGAEAVLTPAEELVAGVWCEVLDLPGVGPDESFFDLGGHSLLATRVVSRLRLLFGVELPVRVLFESPTVAELARAAEAARGEGTAVRPPIRPLPPAARRADLPLSFAQERLWFLDRLEPGSTAYNIATAFGLEGRLDVAALRQALAALVERHEALRTRFGTDRGRPVQRIAPTLYVPLPLVDLSALPEERRQAETSALAAAEAGRPFALERGPLLRAVLLRLGAESHLAALTLHHIVSDGWSMGVL